MSPRIPARLRHVLSAYRSDTRGASMITTAVTLPIFIILLFGVFYSFRTMAVRWSFNRGTSEASQYIAEEAMFWEHTLRGGGDDLYGTGNPMGPPPEDFYEIEAKRIILSRLRDVFSEKMVYDVLTQTLQVTVTEPTLSILAGVPLTSTEIISQSMPISQGVCDRPNRYDQKLLEAEEWRHWKNIRFRVYATMDLPVMWSPKLPYTDPITISVKFKSRSTGLVECTRWSGQRDASGLDKTRLYGQERPALPYRSMATPYYPTITPEPSPTPTITPTMSIPTITPTP